MDRVQIRNGPTKRMISIGTKKNVKLQTINVSVVKESATSLNLFQDGQADDVILTGELAQQMANDEAFVSEPLARTSYIELNQREEISHSVMKICEKQFLMQ